ncbi:glycosyltransferase [Cycloclasticus pugetii]|uniref:glycosyltransferase n=1 Tax=Cycloclasticus pugetii TaxID=34068 RepID=UPI003A92E999
MNFDYKVGLEIRMSEKKIYIDVTTLLNWNRYPVGITRTLFEVVRYYVKENIGYQVFLVSFDRRKVNLRVLSEKEKTSLLEKFEKQEWDKNRKSFFRIFSFYQKLEKLFSLIYKRRYFELFRILYGKLPKPLKHLLKKFIARFSNGFVKKLRDYSESDLWSEIILQEKELAKNEGAFFNKGDYLLSLGLDWDFSNYRLLHEIKKKKQIEIITCFYDSIPLTHPTHVHSDHFGKVFNQHIYKLINISDKIFCISEYSKKCLIDYMNKNMIDASPTLRTIHLGSDIGNEVLEEASNSQDYVLYVSTIESRKNHVLLLRVWKKLIKVYGPKTPKLTFVGMMGWGIEEFKSELKDFPSDYIEIKNNVSDQELISLYRCSQFCVFPSLVEGWGLGAVESMALGKLCLVGDCPAVIEATQGLSPVLKSEEEWFEYVASLIENPGKVADLEKSLTKNFIKRSWTDFCEDFNQFILKN